MEAKLLIRRENDWATVTQLVNLAQGPCVIGRSGSSVDLGDAYCSRLHVALRLSRSSRIELSDLNSKNGTFVNGNRVEVAELKVGDEIRVGHTLITLAKLGNGADDTQIGHTEQASLSDPMDNPATDSSTEADELICRGPEQFECAQSYAQAASREALESSEIF